MNTNCKRCGVGIVAGHGPAVISDLFCPTCFVWRNANPRYQAMEDIPNTPDFRLLGCLTNGLHIGLTVAKDVHGCHYLEDRAFKRRACSEFTGWIADTTKGGAK